MDDILESMIHCPEANKKDVKGSGITGHGGYCHIMHSVDPAYIMRDHPNQSSFNECPW